MEKNLLANPFWGFVLCVAAYRVGLWVNRRTGTPLANPLLVAIVLVAAFLTLFEIPLADFERGGSLLSLMLAPATASLAVSIYHQRRLLLSNLLPILAGCTAGAFTSMASTYFLCRLCGIEARIMLSMLSKSVTTPIAVELAGKYGSLVALAIVAVIVTGITGTVAAPAMIRWLKIEDPLVVGVAIGTSSHALGTAKAAELGEIEGAMSGIAIGVTGLATVFLFIPFSWLFL